jgi:mRNA-degrading endonuclease toxin of MazEF toxin-antitoxin module
MLIALFYDDTKRTTGRTRRRGRNLLKKKRRGPQVVVVYSSYKHRYRREVNIKEETKRYRRGSFLYMAVSPIDTHTHTQKNKGRLEEEEATKRVGKKIKRNKRE